MIHTAVLTLDVIRKHHQLTRLQGPPASRCTSVSAAWLQKTGDYRL